MSNFFSGENPQNERETNAKSFFEQEERLLPVIVDNPQEEPLDFEIIEERPSFELSPLAQSLINVTGTALIVSSRLLLKASPYILGVSAFLGACWLIAQAFIKLFALIAAFVAGLSTMVIVATFVGLYVVVSLIMFSSLTKTRRQTNPGETSIESTTTSQGVTNNFNFYGSTKIDNSFNNWKNK